MAKLNVMVGTSRSNVEEDTPLLWVLRDHVGLTGTKYGCGVAQCGACTVHLDGVATRSCSVLQCRRAGTENRDHRGARGGEAAPGQLAWAELDVAQCGYCQVGMIMAVSALLAQNPSPSDETSARRSPISAGAGPMGACSPAPSSPLPRMASNRG